MKSLRVRRTRIGLISALTIVLLVAVGALAWAHTVFMGEREASLTVWRDDGIAVRSDDSRIVMSPVSDTTDEGLVFLPGARVDPYAYLAKLSGLVENGITVVITKPTLNIALADQRQLDDFTNGIAGVSHWLVGGHSLGGVRACMLAPDSDGLVLFGSYCSTDLSTSPIPVLSLAGANDGLSTPQKIADALNLLPPHATFIEIEGANHASFGDYGVQPGDGEMTTTDAAVRTAITAAVLEFIEKNENSDSA